MITETGNGQTNHCESCESLAKELSAMTQRAEAAEAALTPKPARDGIHPWAVALEPTAAHARYWQEGARKVERHTEALICVDQAVNSWKNACYAYAEKCFNYEARIKASQEQEPVAFIYPAAYGSRASLCRENKPADWGMGDDDSEWYENPLYAAPVIPPDVAALQRENAELTKWKESAIAVMPDYQAIGKLLGVKLGESVHDKILPAITELTRKLAEQQSLYRKIVLLFNLESKEEFMQERGFEELTKLIDEAKSKAVPEISINYFEVQRVCGEFGIDYNKFCAAYRAMLAAAPSPETDIGREQRFK